MRAPAYRAFFVCAAYAANLIASCGISHKSRSSLDQAIYNFGLGAYSDSDNFAYGDLGNRSLKNRDGLGGRAWGRRMIG